MAEPNQLSHDGKSSSESMHGLAALRTYLDVLDFLGTSGSMRRQKTSNAAEPPLPILQDVPGLKNLFLSMSAVAPATPDTNDEEWNPISQRPHAALPPLISDELGAEVTALKTAIDDFTILSHEMMHIALWEPFFAGYWRPQSRKYFREFSLMAEGFCYFYSDIVVSSAVRMRLPDGEFALERQTPSNARFHPVRAFHSLGIDDHQEILGIYLEGFGGQSTRLWQPRGTSALASSLAAQAYDFYAGSQPLLNEVYTALSAFGGLTEFFRRFCAIPGLPSFLTADHSLKKGESHDFPSYFAGFFSTALTSLAQAEASTIESVRWRRILQMRAYYALQVRWLSSQGHIAASGRTTALRQKITNHINVYLDGIQGLLQQLALKNEVSIPVELTRLDAFYDQQVRAKFEAHDAWVGHRWLIAPRRAGGCISTSAPIPAGDREAKRKLTQTISYLIEELTARLPDCKTTATRAALMRHIQCVAELGAKGGVGSAVATQKAVRQLNKELMKPYLRTIWSMPLSSFDPLRNRYRELVFSYQ